MFKLLISLALLLWVNTSFAISLIVNDSVSFSPDSSKDIRNIFTLQQTHWENGNKIQVFVFPDDNDVHQQFSKSVTQMFPYQYRRIWDRVTFSGTGLAPTIVNSMEEMLEKVSQTKNSIGYIENIDKHQSIRVIILQGDENEAQ
ncbi:MAG: hypothetical protein IME94_04055 [Proteobacteria bacterium]|nr:hypothetical protein [Pseudomonadota bacterium]